MPRPTKCRRVCYFPEILEFSSTGAVSGEPIVLTVDELETIRLIDKENLRQEECGAQMALAENGIKLYGGVGGNADEAVNAFGVGNYGIRTGWKSACKRYNKQQQKQADQTTDETVVCNPGVIATL